MIVTDLNQQYLNGINGDLITDPETVANTFINFLSTLVNKQNNLFPKVQSLFHAFWKVITVSAIHFLFLSPVSEFELSLVILSLNNSKSARPNSIPIYLLKILNNGISPCLSKIINVDSVTSGIFPPIFKKGSKADKNNYRPISKNMCINVYINEHCCVSYNI